MIDRDWRSGPPPHVGWWSASKCGDRTTWRWWDGSAWSIERRSYNSSQEAAEAARIISRNQKGIHWNAHYPANARVPRINPAETTKKVTGAKHGN